MRLVRGLRDAAAAPSLQIYRPHFEPDHLHFTSEKLGDMPGMHIGVDNPSIRIAYSPDSSTILIAWRRLPQEDYSDRSLTFALLDRNLKVVKAAFMPFKQFEQDVLVREILVVDEGNLVFTAQTSQAGNVISGPGTTGYGILHYAVAQNVLRLIRFCNKGDVPVETRLAIARSGEIMAAGWYLQQGMERKEAGVFLGRITYADSLEDMQRVPLSESMRAALIRRESHNGAIAIRIGFHSTLLCSNDGFAFVLHLRGEADTGLVPKSPGGKVNNTLHCWDFGPDLAFRGQSMSGFYNSGREEYSETFSWRPLLIDGQWHALATDYSGVKKEQMPIEAQSFSWSIPSNDFVKVQLSSGKNFCVLAPREIVRVGPNAWVGMAVAANRCRLVKLEWK